MLHPLLSRKPTGVFDIAKKTGDVGIEIEMEGTGVHLNHIPSGWDIRVENSLRGESREYVTHGAVLLENVAKTVDILKSALDHNNAVLKPSDRCSVHIHVNMQQQTFRTYIGFVLIFTILEPILLRLCGAKRNGNLFCMPSYETGDLRFFFEKNMSALCREKYPQWWKRGKYASLNTDAMSNFGSVESRVFPFSIDPAEIYEWASWLIRMRDLAKDWKDETYSDLFPAAENLAQKVFKGRNYFMAVQPENISQLLELGCETAYEAWRGCRSALFYEKKEEPKEEVLTVIDLPEGYLEDEEYYDE